MKKNLLILLLFILSLSFSISYADDLIKNACPNGVKSNKSLVKITIVKRTQEKDTDGITGKETIYDTDVVNKNGECFKVGFAKFIYLIDKKHAIYKVYIDSDDLYVYPQLFVFDYGASSVKKRRVSGIIKATGKYATYKDREGFTRKMPQFLVVQEN